MSHFFPRELHPYIIGHYNSSVRIIGLVSDATYAVCFNFIHKWWHLKFKVNSERQICLETFHSSFNYSQELLPEICWEEIAEEILFVFWFDVWPGARTLAIRLIIQHTTYSDGKMATDTGKCSLLMKILKNSRLSLTSLWKTTTTLKLILYHTFLKGSTDCQRPFFLFEEKR